MSSRSLIVTTLLGIVAGGPAWAQATASRPVEAGPATPPAVALVAPGAAEAGVPPAAWRQADPADSLYRAAREALNRGEYPRAAELFGQIVERHPDSTYAPDALYWQAFALYRSGGDDELRTALRALDRQRAGYPRAATRGDAEALAVRIRGTLARLGDAEAAAAITETAEALRVASEVLETVEVAEAVEVANEAANEALVGGTSGANPECVDEDNDIRLAALNALLQMDADRALPILRQVLERRDECSAPLRRKAVFLVSQKQTAETEDILLDVARNDPDAEVRRQAVFWLSQVPTERAVDALENVLATSEDPALQERALFALSQHRSDRAGQILRRFAAREDASPELREKAIFWLGQQGSAENATFLQSLFGRLEDPELKEKVLFSLSQMRGHGTGRWLLDVALAEGETVEVRKKALFWAGQGGAPIADLAALYDRMENREMKEQLIFVYSQRDDSEAVSKLIDIARNESDVELRKRAIFWLSQSDDPRAAELLMEIINHD